MDTSLGTPSQSSQTSPTPLSTPLSPPPPPSPSPCQVFSRRDLCFINIKSDLLAMKFVRALANLDERRESFSAPVPFSF